MIKYLIIIIYLMCNLNIDSRAQHNPIFKNVREKPTEKKDYYFGYLNDSISIHGRVGYKFIFIDRNINDTMIGYWNIFDYTLYYWSDHSYKERCYQITPFASLKQPRVYNICEQKCYEYRNLVFGGNCIEISNVAMNNNEISTNHILYSHRSHQRSFYRKYRISYFDGIIDYQTDYQNSRVIIDFPY